MFGNEVLRKILGLTGGEVMGNRIKLYSSPNIIRVTKSRKMSTYDEKRNACRVW